MDVWTKTAPDDTTIVFKKEGSEEAGFVYTAEGRTITQTQAMEEELTRRRSALRRLCSRNETTCGVARTATVAATRLPNQFPGSAEILGGAGGSRTHE